LFRFKDTEYEFLDTYEPIMKPVAKALDILQGDKNTKFGFLVPTLEELRKRLEKQKSKLTENSSVCLPLVNAVLDAITRRFSVLLEDPEAIAAAILIPSMKDLWTDDTALLELGW
jgi:hypothetical protein